jgi:hypothetical protein
VQADIAKIEELGGNCKKEIDGEYKLDVERFAKAISAWEVERNLADAIMEQHMADMMGQSVQESESFFDFGGDTAAAVTDGDFWSDLVCCAAPRAAVRASDSRLSASSSFTSPTSSKGERVGKCEEDGWNSEGGDRGAAAR